MKRLPVLLIVEDPDLARLMAKDIDARGYQPFVALAVEEALRLLAQHSFSLIVADFLGPRQRYWDRWPIIHLLSRFAPRTPILALSMLRDLPEKGEAVAAIVRLPDYSDDLEKGLSRYALAVPEGTPDPFLARYLAALWEANSDEAARVVADARIAGWGGPAIYEGLFASALYEMGSWWGDDSCTIADEHGAWAITERLMAGVANTAERKPHYGRLIIVACVEGEGHSLGARMAADFFEWDGWSVRLLGAGIPAAEVIGEARRRKADAVGLSATMQPSWEMVRTQIEGLRAVGTTTVLLGGQAFRQLDKDAFAALGATARAGSALDGVELANRLTMRRANRSIQETRQDRRSS